MVSQKPPPKRLPPAGKVRLPALQVKGKDIAKAFLADGLGRGGGQTGIPNASLIYGVAAAAMVAFGIYHLLQGGWGTFLLLLLVAGALFGFALYYLRHAE